MSYEDVCAIAWKAGKGAGKKGPNGSETRHHGKGADEWTSGRRGDGGKKGGKKGSKGRNLVGTVTRLKEALEAKERARAKARARARVKPDTTGSKKGSKGSKPDWYGDKDKRVQWKQRQRQRYR